MFVYFLPVFIHSVYSAYFLMCVYTVYKVHTLRYSVFILYKALARLQCVHTVSIVHTLLQCVYTAYIVPTLLLCLYIMYTVHTPCYSVYNSVYIIQTLLLCLYTTYKHAHFVAAGLAELLGEGRRGLGAQGCAASPADTHMRVGTTCDQCPRVFSGN